MSNDLQPYYSALEKADKAGDVKGAKKLADFIRSKEAQPEPQNVESLDVSGAETVARGVSGIFQPQEKKDVSAEELAGAVGGGAASGAASGALLPHLLEGAGKVVPGAAGKAIGALGTAMSRVPVKERMLAGAGGGALMGGVEKGAEAMGAPPALALGAGLVAGGVGETAASFLAKESKQLLGVFGNAATGNLAGSARALKGMLEPNKPLNLETAARVQKQLFGEKTAGDLTAVGSEYKLATAKGLRSSDPSLPPLGVNPAPASEIYRDKMFQGVTAGVKQGKGFSATPEYRKFEQGLSTLVTLKEISPEEAKSLVQALRADRSNNPKVLERYAETVDNRIRQWGKPAEGAQATGAAAIDAKISAEVRGELQKAYNQYTQKLGLGPIETQYRRAYSAEMTAEAMDKLQKGLQPGLIKGKELASMMRSISNDPQALPIVQQAVTKHLANTEPTKIVQEFDRLQKMLVAGKMLEASDLKVLREAANVVDSIADKGLQQRYAVRLKQMVLMRVAGQVGVAAGGRVGETAGSGEGR